MPILTPTRDNKHIFSELEDPEKIALIQEILAWIGEAHLQRWCLWVLYLRDIHQLRLDIQKVRDESSDSDDALHYDPWYNLSWISSELDEDDPSIFGFSKAPQSPSGHDIIGTEISDCHTLCSFPC